MYIIESAIVTITKATPKMIVHFFNIPSLVLPLFFSKKLFVDEPVIVDDNPASSLDCIIANIVKATHTIKSTTTILFLLLAFSIPPNGLYSFYYDILPHIS